MQRINKGFIISSTTLFKKNKLFYSALCNTQITHYNSSIINCSVNNREIDRNDKLPLSHLRVLDLSRVLAGPYCTQLLSDLGAEVIKIEPPNIGDDTRFWQPPSITVVNKENTMKENQSGYFQCTNRNKKSITVNLKSKNGQDIVKKLIEKSDIVIENFKVGSLEKFGLDYKTIKTIKPDIIYCSITGYGQNTSKSHLPGYDYVMQAKSGLMSITGGKETEPFKVGVAISDVMTGMYAAVSILTKVIEKERKKQNSDEFNNNNNWIDLSLFDCSLAYLVNQASNFLQTGKSPKRIGNSHPNIVPYDLIKCKDGFIVIAVGNDNQFKRFISVITKDNVSSFPDIENYLTNKERVQRREKLMKQIEDITSKEFEKEQLIFALDEEGIPCGPVNSVEEALNDSQTVERNMIWKYKQRDDLNDIKVVGNPIKFLNEEKEELDLSQFSQPPPLLSQHTEQVLKEIVGASDEDITTWRREGTI
ncbi:hypothetical protein ABK040_005790 [Willaertia magna]